MIYRIRQKTNERYNVLKDDHFIVPEPVENKENIPLVANSHSSTTVSPAKKTTGSRFKGSKLALECLFVNKIHSL